MNHCLTNVGAESRLIADRTLLKGERPQVLSSGQSRVNASTAGSNYVAIVAATNQTVASLSQEIATAIWGEGPSVFVR